MIPEAVQNELLRNHARLPDWPRAPALKTVGE
jgi:hypothetical protein